MAGIKFVPESEEEANWIVSNYIEDKDFQRVIDPSHLLYTNGQFVLTKNIYMWAIPIKNNVFFYMRAIVYALRRFSDEQLKQKIFTYDVYRTMEMDKERTKRAILKFWSIREHETSRKDFADHYLKLLNFNPTHFATFIRVCDRLMAYGFWVIEHHRGRRSRMKAFVRLTELGQKIVKLHRDKHFIF